MAEKRQVCAYGVACAGNALCLAGVRSQATLGGLVRTECLVELASPAATYVRAFTLGFQLPLFLLVLDVFVLWLSSFRW